ncbi:alpha/beta hydrolase [Mariprofundus ferrooxydans]|nr:alpha/beta hydrolase [Mariprofundus ferrooxydans]
MIQYCTVDGYSIAYARSGKADGEVMLLVHGITTYSFIWRKLLPFLEHDYDVIAVDLLGCGESDMPLDESYAIKDHAERLYRFMYQLGISRFHFVGHDLGGGIAQIFAVQHEEMLISLSMINMVAYDFWPVQPITAMRAPVVRQLLMGALDLGMLRLFVKAGLYHKERLNDELMDLFWKPLKRREGRKAFMHFARCLDNHNLMEISDELKLLRVPTLILRGDADPFLGATIAQRLHAGMPDSQLQCIATASHYLMEDEPEWAAQQILTFIEADHAT